MHFNKTKFQKDVHRLRVKFPDIQHFPTRVGYHQLKGELPVYDSNGNLQDVFFVKIIYGKTYPYGFAKLFEIGGDIPKSPKWHKYSSSQCCVCSLPEELIQQEKENDIFNFIEEYAIPFLANFLYKKRFNKYPNGEYAHGKQGVLQWYLEKFPDRSTIQIANFLSYLVSNKNESYDSGIDLSSVERSYLDQIQLIPSNIISEHILLLKNEL